MQKRPDIERNQSNQPLLLGIKARQPTTHQPDESTQQIKIYNGRSLKFWLVKIDVKR